VNKEFIATEITKSMRSGDKLRLSILRQVKNEIDTKEKNERVVLSDEQVVAALKKVLKQTAETLDYSRKLNTDPERTLEMERKVSILEEYLPTQVTGAALETIVDGVLASEGIVEKRDMGRAIGRVVELCHGACDKSEVAKIVGIRLAAVR
jgi:uncharacterized protein YqeY